MTHFPRLSTRVIRAFSALIIVSFSCSFAAADLITIVIGDDDGFGGTQGSNSNPGDAFTVFNSPVIAPGTYTDTDGMDSATASPWTPYVFQFNFDFDSTQLESVDSAIVTIQTGSIARRTDGSGYGFANVTSNIGGDTLDLGDFLNVSTNASGSAAEESVKLHAFDVTSLFSSITSGTLTIEVNGSALSDPLDQFSIDFAQLDLQGTAIPEPSGLCFLVMTAVSTGIVRRRKLPVR